MMNQIKEKNMRKLRNAFSILATLCAAILLCSAAPANNSAASGSKNQNLKVGIVNFKQVVENSKIGKQEQASFEALKKQMESVLAEKEKTINEMATKFNDADYLDSLSPEAETELKRKFRTMNQELAQQQQQYMQSLQQTNFKVIQKINEQVVKAAQSVAKNEGLDIILNEEACYFCASNIDMTQKIISILDQEYEKEGANKNASSEIKKAG